MVKRERDPLSPFAASPSLWPFPPVSRASRPFGSPTLSLFISELLAFPLLATEKGAGAGGHPFRRFARNTRGGAGGKRPSSLYVTSLLHCGFGAGLGFRERLVDGHRSRESSREVLPDVSRNALELGDRHELHARVGHRLHRRMQRVSRVDRFQRQIGKRRGLRVVGILVERCARARRNARPAQLRSDEIEVMFVGRPRNELLRRIRILCASWDAERP